MNLKRGAAATALFVATMTGIVGVATAARALTEARPLPLSQGVVRVGREWLVVVVGNSKCKPSNDARLPAAIRDIIRLTHTQAASMHEGYLTWGIATDLDHRAANHYLQTIGEFDQVSTGGVWRNHSLRHVLELMPTEPAATPTMLIISRAVELTAAGTLKVTEERVATKLVGVQQILAYAAWLRGNGDELSADSAGTALDATLTSPLQGAQ